ncbi:MAG TPA: HAD family hydrolase [Pyrinomonadaceae bacterium]|nr:HAD family hydrolase [Pyrinomonadaceae bacterium]
MAAIKLPERIKLVSWDVDGTLYSIRRMKWHVMRRFLVEMIRGRGLKARKELSALQSYRDRVNDARSSGGALNKFFVDQNSREDLLEIEKRWYGPAIQKTGPREGVANVMSFLGERGFLQVVISDYEAAYKLESLGLADRFAAIYVGERLGFVKPSPVGFQRAVADFQTSTTRLVHIGDRADRDDAGARAAGCQCLILGRDFRSFAELLDLLQSRMSEMTDLTSAGEPDGAG